MSFGLVGRTDTEWRFRDWDGDGGSGMGTAEGGGARGGTGESDLVPLAIVDAGEIRFTCIRAAAVAVVFSRWRLKL